MKSFRTATVVALVLLSFGVGVGKARAVDDQNCEDFPSQAAAQQHLREDPSDPDKLDANNDGVACENNPAPYDRTPVTRSNSSTTVQPVRTTSTTAVITVRDLTVPAVRAPSRAKSATVASTGPTENAIALSAAGVVLLVVGSRLRGRQAPGEHWV